MSGDYECTLTAASLEVALRELGEDPRERMSCVQTLRDWARTQPHIICDPDARFLLRFLRTGKFSQLAARTKLEKWLTALDLYPAWIRDVDTGSKPIQDFFDNGYLMILPGLDREGRKVILLRPGQLDTSEKVYSKDFTLKAELTAYMAMSCDENVQVNGIVYFVDLTGYEMRHLTFFGLDDMRKMMKLWQGAMPGRFKAFHFYNTGPVFEALMSMMIPLLTGKMKGRFHPHGNNLENIYKVVPMEILPVEYLPDDYTGKHAGTIAENIEALKAYLREPRVREPVKHYTSSAYGTNESKRIKDEPQESFRQLNVE